MTRDGDEDVLTTGRRIRVQSMLEWDGAPFTREERQEIADEIGARWQAWAKRDPVETEAPR